MKRYSIADTKGGGAIRPIIGLATFIIVRAVIRVWALFVLLLRWIVKALDYALYVICWVLQFCTTSAFLFLSSVILEAGNFEDVVFMATVRFCGFDIVEKEAAKKV